MDLELIGRPQQSKYREIYMCLLMDQLGIGMANIGRYLSIPVCPRHWLLCAVISDREGGGNWKLWSVEIHWLGIGQVDTGRYPHLPVHSEYRQQLKDSRLHTLILGHQGSDHSTLGDIKRCLGMDLEHFGRPQLDIGLVDIWVHSNCLTMTALPHRAIGCPHMAPHCAHVCCRMVVQGQIER